MNFLNNAAVFGLIPVPAMSASGARGSSGHGDSAMPEQADHARSAGPRGGVRERLASKDELAAILAALAKTGDARTARPLPAS